MQQDGINYFARKTPHPNPGVRSKSQNSTFSDYCHVAYYQIKWNHKCSNMAAIIWPADHYPPTPDLGGEGTPNRIDVSLCGRLYYAFSSF